MRSILWLPLVAFPLAVPLLSQQPTPFPTAVPATSPTPFPFPAQVATSSEGMVTVVPDRATIRLSVLTREPTAREAGAANAGKQRAVIDALRALGVARDHISTSGYTLQPEMRYGPNMPPQVTGYTASNTLTVELTTIEQVGAAIDAALAAGANEVAGLTFTSSHAEEARREAIGKAVARAQKDAEAAARGAGQTLGQLMSIEVDMPSIPRPVMYGVSMKAMSAQSQSTPVEAGTQEVRVSVSTRWLVR